MMRKGQVRWVSGTDVLPQIRFIKKLFEAPPQNEDALSFCLEAMARGYWEICSLCSWRKSSSFFRSSGSNDKAQKRFFAY
jgi:hypothetical protein